MTIDILHKDSLPLGGFAGLKEHRLVVDSRIGGNESTWEGHGNFVYLADAYFLPKGETRMHGHKEIDVISVLVDGRITHEGSLEHGRSMVAGQAQAQRAGAEGFSHNEINPDDEKNRMLQLWVLPEVPGANAQYKFYDLTQGKTTRIYGGAATQNDTLDSHTVIDVGMLSAGQTISRQGTFLAYISKGTGELNGETIKNGDLVRGLDLAFKAIHDDTQIIIITVE